MPKRDLENQSVILTGFPPPPKLKAPGRPKFAGCNYDLLRMLTPGDLMSCIYVSNLGKTKGIYYAAKRMGAKVIWRKLHDGRYCVWREK